MKILFILFFVSIVFSQGMYIGSEDLRNVYSLNTKLSSLSEGEEQYEYYMLGLSALLKSKNQYEINFYKTDYSKNIELGYTYYVKPKFYLNMNLGLSYSYTFENQTPNQNIKDQYKTQLSIYGNGNSKSNKSTLKYYPFYTYEYVYRYNDLELEKFDIHKIGFSILFNDIGIEPSYSFISKDVNEISIKVYLWEFGT